MLAGLYDARAAGAAERDAVAAAAADGPAQLPAAIATGDDRLAVAVAGGTLDEGNGLVCALDGAVYNLDALAAPAGLDPSAPPARLIAQLWRLHGDDLFARLRGDFVVLAWDRATAAGAIARDQMGGRGLVWRERTDGVLAFASELRPLLRLLPSRPGPDPTTVAHWLAVSGLPGAHSMHAGVRRLEAGRLLRLGSAGVAVERYWAPAYGRPLNAPRAEHVARLRAALTEAVARRSSGGAETAVMLSGGLDSSTVAALAARAVPRERTVDASYSAVFPRHPTIDEGALIDETAAELGLHGVRAVVRRGSVLAGALRYIDAWQLPPMSPNLFFWTPLLERAAADGVRVMLDGEGGDELFGLSIHLLSDRLRRGRLLSAARLTRRTPLPGGHPLRATQRLLTRYGVPGALPPVAHRLSRRLRGESHYAPPWFRPQAARALLEAEQAAAWKHLDGPRWWAALVEAVINGMGPALGYDHVRRRAALTGIEPRHPLVDVDVIELVLRQPPELAFDPRHTRPLQREALAGLIPDSVRLRSLKSSFDALFHESLAGPDLPAVRRILGAPDARVGEYLDLAAMRREVVERDPPSGGGELQAWALRVWRAITAECWLREQEDPGFASELQRDAQLASPDLVLLRTSA